MKEFRREAIRNVGFIAHGGEGKTSLAEAILFDTGETTRLGKVQEGNTIMDFEPEEIGRKISISSSLCHIEWKDYLINIIDTPGDANFIADAKGCLKVVDGAVVLVSAVSGVKVQTEEVWGYADEFEIPRIIFVNEMDRERGSFFRTLEAIEKVLKVRTIPLYVPIGSEASFKGVADLIKNKAYVYNLDESGKYKEEAPSKEMVEEILKLKEKMMDVVAEADDSLLEKYLEGEELTEEEILYGLREGTLKRKFTPVLCGSALKNIAIQPLLDAILTYLPSPTERGSIKGTNPSTKEMEERKQEPLEPFSAFVFKTIADPFTGKLSLFRVYSGSLNSDSTIYNASKDCKERFGQIFLLQGKKQKPVEKVQAGDIAAVAKLKDTATGDTLCDEKKPIIFDSIKWPSPALTVAVEPKSRGDEEKITLSLAKLREEDPAIQVYRGPQTKELILAGIGQVHLEVAAEKLKRKFGVDMELKIPKVPYKETIKSSIKVQGKYKRQSGGRGQYGDTWLEIEPLPRGTGFEFVDKVVGGVIPKQYIPSVEKGIREAIEEGVLAGYPIADVKVTLYDGSYHSVDSSDIAFKIAGSMGFKKGIQGANPVLLEPIYKTEVQCREENLGDVIGDLNSRRGKVLGIESKQSSQIVNAEVPLAEVLRYASDLTALTGGRGNFSMEFSHYEEVPGHLAEKIIAESKKKGE